MFAGLPRGHLGETDRETERKSQIDGSLRIQKEGGLPPSYRKHLIFIKY